MVSRAEQFRNKLTEDVERALEEGLSHPHQRNMIAIEGELDLDELAIWVVDVFAAALDEIHESGGEIPDIKTSAFRREQ